MQLKIISVPVSTINVVKMPSPVQPQSLDSDFDQLISLIKNNFEPSFLNVEITDDFLRIIESFANKYKIRFDIARYSTVIAWLTDNIHDAEIDEMYKLQKMVLQQFLTSINANEDLLIQYLVEKIKSSRFRLSPEFEETDNVKLHSEVYVLANRPHPNNVDRPYFVNLTLKIRTRLRIERWLSLAQKYTRTKLNFG